MTSQDQVGTATPPAGDHLSRFFADQLDYVGQLADEASAQPDPWAGLTGFLHSILALQAEYRGLLDYMFGPRALERAGASTARLTPVLAELLARAKASGQVRRDVTIEDVALVPVMVGAVLERSRGIAPDDAWQRVLAVVLDGFRPAAEPLPGRPLRRDELDALLGGESLRD